MKSLSFNVSIIGLFLLVILTMSKSHAMMRSLNTAATGMSAQEEHVNAISNNIANVNTTGYKLQRVEIEDLMYETRQEAGARSSADTMYNVGIQTGSGARVAATRREYTQGAPQITNNPFDLMINGTGFFAVVLPNNEVRFTRDGSFNVDNTGVLVTRQGYRVFPNFTFPPGTTSVNIGEDGTVEAYLSNQVDPMVLGQIPVFTFINPVGLRSLGGNLVAPTNSSGQPMQHIAGTENAGPIMQGALESSNVSIMNEMTNLIRAQRAYEMNSRVMGVADQMLQTVNNIR